MKAIARSGIALIAFLVAPVMALGASKSCLTGTDPSVVGDLAQITAVRAAIASACPCSSFDGSAGKTHAAYLKCAKGVIATAVSGSSLRTQCKGTVTSECATSTCGDPAVKNMVPCVTKSAKAKVKCAIKPAAKCAGAACPDYTACIDAADTNADGLIGVGDSGACAPTAPPSNSTPTATSTPTTAPTSIPPPPPPTNTPGVPMNFTASLDGAQAGTGSAATGSCMATLDGFQTSLSIMCTHNVAMPTAAHIHSDDLGGAIVFPFSSPASPINATWMNMMPADVASLKAGHLYVNIHTNSFPGGEIRGQLVP